MSIARKCKKGMALVLAVMMLVCFVPVPVRADIEGDGYSFKPDTGMLTIHSNEGTTAWRNDDKIPKESVKSVEFAMCANVVKIGENAFADCVNLTGIVSLNAKTEEIGANAFSGCEKLNAVLIPECVKDDIAGAGIPEDTGYVIYAYEYDSFFVKDVKPGSQEQISYKGEIDVGGSFICGVELVADEKFDMVTASSGWYYRMSEDDKIDITKIAFNKRSDQIEIRLPKEIAGRTVNQYADSIFEDESMDASVIFVADESTRVTFPDKVSRVITTVSDDKKEAYFTPGNVGTVQVGMLPVYVDTLYVKDAIVSRDFFAMNRCTAVLYTENADGTIVISDVVLSGHVPEMNYIVPTSIKGSPVSTVMVNSIRLNEYRKISVDESVNEIIYNYNEYSDTDTVLIQSVKQGSKQTSVEIPARIAGKDITSVPEEALDASIKCVVVSDSTEINVPESVGKITYKEDESGNITVTEVIAGKDDAGQEMPVCIPASIGGSKTVMSDEAKGSMNNIPHTHQYASPIFTWSDDNKSCKAEMNCTVCQHGITEEVSFVSEIIQERTCTLPEITGYTAEFTESAFGVQKKQENTKEAAGHIPGEWVVDKAATVEEAGSRHKECTVCGETIETEEIKKLEPQVYKILDGADSSWIQKDNKSLSIRGSGEFTKFQEVKVDGKVVDPKYYTITEGSTIVTFHEDFLKSLSEGEHSFELVWTDGSATTSFEVAKNTTEDEKEDNKKEEDKKDDTKEEDIKKEEDKKQENVPIVKTGDTSDITFWMLVCTVSLAGLIGLLVRSKKNNR